MYLTTADGITRFYEFPFATLSTSFDSKISMLDILFSYVIIYAGVIQASSTIVLQGIREVLASTPSYRGVKDQTQRVVIKVPENNSIRRNGQIERQRVAAR